MDSKERYDTCNKCGRPFPKAAPKCNYTCGCEREYCGKMSACIRNKQPDCLAKAVIPSITVETVDGLTNLANCFVHVTGINTTFYIDDKHRPMIIWAGPVEADVPGGISTDEEFVAFVKTFNLRSQYLYARYYSTDTHSYGIMAVYFDKNGKPYWAGEYNEMVGGGII